MVEINENTEVSKTNLGGSMVEDNVNKTLDALLNAFESRIKPDTVLPPKLLEYPNPLKEKLDMIKNHHLIIDTQTMMEGRP